MNVVAPDSVPRSWLARLAIARSKWGVMLPLAIAICVVVLVELIVSGMEYLLLRKVTWDYLLTGLVASGVAGPASLVLLYRLLDEVERIRHDSLNQQLGVAQERLRVAQQAGQMVFWEFDISSAKLSFSETAMESLGVDAPINAYGLQDWLSLVHPQDRAAFEAAVSQTLSGQQRLFDVEYRIKGANKDWVWVQSRGLVTQQNPQGQPVWAAGGTVNIDARKAAELALEDTRHFVDGLFEALPIPVFYKDRAGRYLGFNTSFEKFFRKSRAELLGRTVFETSPPELAARYAAQDQVLFDAPGTQVYEAQLRDQDDVLHDVEFHKASYCDSQGAVAGLVGAVFEITERKRAEELIWHQANFDVLTGLPNRRMARDRLSQWLKQAARSGTQLALLFLDLDKFKEVNDTFGHAKGDLLLTQVAQRLRACVREADTVARLGGDEFMVILGDLDGVDAATRVAQSIVEALVRPFDLHDEQAWVSASVGIALYPDDAPDADNLSRYADQAMYQAKGAGRNRFCRFSSALADQTHLRVALLADLKGAAERGELWLAYQPIVELASDRVVKAEALLRWQHPTRGLVLPDSFIALAEESGQIHALGDWVLSEAAQQQRRWNKRWGEGFQISVNKSPLQIQARLGERPWKLYLEGLGIAPSQLVVEITEGTLLHLTPTVARELLAFRDAGVEVALDDFGTAYSSLANLTELDIDYIKIDRRFVARLVERDADRLLTSAIVAMAHKLGLRVIAEGVETQAQRDALHAMGCDFGQGFWWSRPLNAPDFEAWMDAHSSRTQCTDGALLA